MHRHTTQVHYSVIQRTGHNKILSHSWIMVVYTYTAGMPKSRNIFMLEKVNDRKVSNMMRLKLVVNIQNYVVRHCEKVWNWRAPHMIFCDTTFLICLYSCLEYYSPNAHSTFWYLVKVIWSLMYWFWRQSSNVFPVRGLKVNRIFRLSFQYGLSNGSAEFHIVQQGPLYREKGIFAAI